MKNTGTLDFILGKCAILLIFPLKTRILSLGVYIDKYKPKYAIRVSTKNFGFENGIKSVPLYAAFLIK